MNVVFAQRLEALKAHKDTAFMFEGDSNRDTVQ